MEVTRRYDRSGESEYFLNRKSVRLRDIHELFMDTGLGRDGYSVIGQGRIDEILSVRAQDRREIFDEAAGITKYRWRREEAERKLAAAEENLLRVGDLVTELESQLVPMGRQAENESTTPCVNSCGGSRSDCGCVSCSRPQLTVPRRRQSMCRRRRGRRTAAVPWRPSMPPQKH